MHRFDVKNIKTTKNYKTIKLRWICIDLMSKRSKQRKTTKRSNYNELHRFDVITIKNVELRRNAFKTTQNYKSNQITMTCIYLMSKLQKTKIVIILRWICIDLMSKRSKMLSYVSMHSKQRSKLQKCIKLRHDLHRKCWVTSQTFKTTQNYKSDQITMTLHRFDVKTIKTTQNYKNDQITMNCIDLTS